MAREVDEARKPFLWNLGDKVYMQGNAKKIRSKNSQITAAAFSKQEIVDWIMQQHGQILELEDIFPNGPDEASRFSEATERVMFESGSHGMILSQFWIEEPPTEKQLAEDPEAGPNCSIYCFVLVQDKMVLVPYDVCTKVH